MAEISIQALNELLPFPFPGMDKFTTCQIRPLQTATLLSIANRFLRPDFPIQRDYDLSVQVVNKGFVTPQLSRNQLQGLPIISIEQLTSLILEVSTAEEMDSQDAVNNQLLSLIIALEETCQYDLASLVSEDLALLESHQQGGLHSYCFKPSQNWELLAQVLQSQGYRSDLMPQELSTSDPLLAYWLCRRMTVVFPWMAILKHLNAEYFESFPYLYRLQKISHFLQKEATTSAIDFNRDIPQVYAWIKSVFPRYSQKAKAPRPLQELVLVEGSTEETLIPAIAKALGYDLDFEGILIQPVGGKNQMLQQYVDYAEHLAVPITIIMDKDAQPLMPDLTYYQRPQDHILILEDGEFEDTYPLEIIAKTINTFYQPSQTLSLSTLRQVSGENMAKMLQGLWPELGLGEFDKVEFAQNLVQTLQHEKHLSPSMKSLVERLMEIKTTYGASLSD